MEIPFTRYKLPDGRKSIVIWDTDHAISIGSDFTKEHEVKAQTLMNAGCRFEIEILSTGVVHMDCQTADGETVLANALCKNSNEVPPNVIALIEKAYDAWRWRPA